jgi:hypothetical protein
MSPRRPVTLLLALLVGAAVLRADKPASASPRPTVPPAVVLSAATLHKAVVRGDWSATRPTAIAAAFPGWPDSNQAPAAAALRFFFSGALILPRTAPEIAFYNPWLDAAILVRWRPPADEKGTATVTDLLFSLPSAPGKPPAWLASPDLPLRSLPRALQTFDASWRETGLHAATAEADAFLDHARTNLGLLVEAHRFLAQTHPALHRAIAEKRVEAWSARLPETVDPLRERLLALPAPVRDRLALGGAWPLGEDRLLLALWPESLPRIAVLLLYNPRAPGGLTDLVFFDLNHLAEAGNTP